LSPDYNDIVAVYYNRAHAYQNLGEIAKAKADFDKIKELTGIDVP